MLSKGKMRTGLKNIMLSLSFAGILIAFLVILNTSIGRVSQPKKTEAGFNSPNSNGLIFEPNTSARYSTVEFDYVAKINSIGLREKEISINKGDKYRVLCFGDSWTFGWGVDVINSWPNKLERYFHERGLKNIEVINAGQGGQYTKTYKEYMSRAVPLLKPDLVLVGVLQIDDLAQLYENSFANKSVAAQKEKKVNTASISLSKKISAIFYDFTNASFNNIFSLFKKPKTVNVKSNWAETSGKIIESYSGLQKLRFHALDDTIQSLFRSGNLNPALLEYYIAFPERMTIFNNPAHPMTKFSIAEMQKDIDEMKLVCNKGNAKLVFINLPINNFTGHIVTRTPADILNTYFEKNNKIDSIYQNIAISAGLPYIELTDTFTSLRDKRGYFFLFDGHPNEKGYEIISSTIGSKLIEDRIIVF
jgi:lysophospholipase L1-like esterase